MAIWRESGEGWRESGEIVFSLYFQAVITHKVFQSVVLCFKCTYTSLIDELHMKVGKCGPKNVKLNIDEKS